MLGYLDDLQERFFTWCDKVVQDYIDREKAEFKQWWPRKSPDGSYELVFKLDARDKGVSTQCTIPDEFHELLEREYFIDHPPDKEEPTTEV